MVDYLGPTASLLESNTKSLTADKDRKASAAAKVQDNLLSESNTAAEQAGAMDRTKVQGKQQELLQAMRDQAGMALENLQQQEASKRQEKLLKEQAAMKHQEDYFTMTPNTVKGIKNTIGMDFKDLEGKEVNKDVILGLIAAKYKTDIAELKAEVEKGKTGTKSSKDLDKELDNIEKNIKANRDSLFKMSIKDLPEEVWQGGKPGDMRTLVQNISGNKLGELSPEAQNQVKLVAGYINTMKSQQERANKIHEQKGTTKTDYTGFGLGDEQKTYNSAEEVRAAYKAGQISRDAAKQILAEKFNIK